MSCDHKDINFVQTAELAVVTCKCGLAASGPTMEIAKAKFDVFSKMSPKKFSCIVQFNLEVEANNEKDVNGIVETLMKKKLEGLEYIDISIDDVEEVVD